MVREMDLFAEALQMKCKDPTSAEFLEKAGFNFERQEVDEEGPYWVYFRRF